MTPTTSLQLPRLLSHLSTAPPTRPPAPPYLRWTRVLPPLSCPHRGGTRLVITRPPIMAPLKRPPTTLRPPPTPYATTRIRTYAGPARLPRRQETSSLLFEVPPRVSLNPDIPPQSRRRPGLFPTSHGHATRAIDKCMRMSEYSLQTISVLSPPVPMFHPTIPPHPRLGPASEGSPYRQTNLPRRSLHSLSGHLLTSTRPTAPGVDIDTKHPRILGHLSRTAAWTAVAPSTVVIRSLE